MNNFFFTIIKLVLAVLLLPVVFACGVSFQHQLKFYPSTYAEFFFWGILFFLLIFIFVYQFWGVYEFGQKAMQGMLKFIEPFNDTVACMIPFYPTLTMLLFYVVLHVFRAQNSELYFMFFTGFALAMHVFLTAQDLQDKERTAIKSAYLFKMSLIVISNICIMVLLLNLVAQKWTFLTFLEHVVENAKLAYVFSFDKISF